MSATYCVDQNTGRAFFYVSYSYTAGGTFHTDHMTLDAKAAIAEASFIVRDSYMRFNSPFLPKRDEVEDDEEREWDTLFALPHVQMGLSRLAEEAERQFAAGETEEGGFAIE